MSETEQDVNPLPPTSSEDIENQPVNLPSNHQRLSSRLRGNPYYTEMLRAMKNMFLLEIKSDQNRALGMKEELQSLMVGNIEELWEDFSKGKFQMAAKNFGPKSGSSQMNRLEVKRHDKPAKKESSQKYISHNTSHSNASMRAGSPNNLSMNSRSGNQSMYRSLNVRSYEELNAMSEFTRTSGAGTFSKSTRFGASEGLPGPADYQTDPVYLRQKSPRVMIPQGGRRIDFHKNPTNPGPGQYYPSRHYASK